jgi:nucleotidyltransferase substrate binding protein (TIGR01987 family)
MALNLTPLENAIARLEEMLARYSHEEADPAVRDSVIKRFEFTYEMTAKLLKLALQAASASPETYNQMSFPDLVRSGNDQGLLLSDWAAWKGFREMRNKSSHIYDEAIALEVAKGASGFLPEAIYLRDQIRERAL